jgi:uncharacterized protein (DUF2252 family)
METHTPAPHTARSRPLSVAERTELGKAARARTPRSAHAAFEPAPTRPDPVEVLETQARTRVPELIGIRYGRMLVSPFTFYRGAAAIMTADLATSPRTDLTVQCCGDAHLSNFGVFASPERRLVFDLNDFDETLPGPWEWDVKRLAVSMLIAARDNGYRAGRQDEIVLTTVQAYRQSMRDFAQMPMLNVWYSHLDVENAVREFAGRQRRTKATVKGLARAEKALAKARTRDSLSAFRKLTEVVDGHARIADQAPLIVPIGTLAAGIEPEAIFTELERLFGLYRDSIDPDRRVLLDEYELCDFARKVVGVGSVGTRAWIALLMARDNRDPLLMQIKQAEASVLEAHLAPSEFPNHGQRVVAGQRLMQAQSDIFLGWVGVDSALADGNRDFYVRQLKDWKGSAVIEEMPPKNMSVYGQMCGWTLARAHARSGDRIAIAAYLGSGDGFDRALLEFSKAYAEQNERDYAALAQAAQDGRITAEHGL